MKRTGKGIALTMGILLLAAATMGGCSSSSSETKETAGVSAGESSEAATTEKAEETEVATEVTAVSVDEQVLFDANDIKITATGMEDGFIGTELKLLIENNSAQPITVQARNANVNGYMVDTVMSADVAAGKKANDSLTFTTSGLKECGIEDVATMEFSFHICNADSWEDILDTDVIHVDTSIAEGYVQSYDDSGEVLVDTNGIKIVKKGLSEEDSFWGPGVVLYIENNSDQDVTIQVRDVSVNGFMVDSSMSEDVVAGKKAISAVQFFSTDLEENSITEITDVELYFHIFNASSWDTLFDSDVISMTF